MSGFLREVTTNMITQRLHSALYLLAIIACWWILYALEANPGTTALADSVLADAINPAHVPMPPGSLEQILFGEAFDRNVKPEQIKTVAEERAFVWGSHVPLLKAGGYGSFYYPSMRDIERSHDIKWYQKNKPEWVVYENDRKTPAYDFVYSWGAAVPLDVTRQDVRDYILNTYLLPAIKQGYPAIAFDNVTIANIHHKCGVYHNAQWVQQFSDDERDPAFATAVLDYLSYIRDQVHARGAALVLNAKIDPERPELSWKMLALADIWSDEGGFSHESRNDIVDQVWDVKSDLAYRKAAEGGYFGINTTAETLSKLSDSEITWILANFLLVRGPHSYLSITPANYNGYFLPYPASYNPPVGHPTGQPHKHGSVHLREYQNGLVAVNPSSTAPAAFTIPTGRWTDSRGNIVSGNITLAPRSGLVLIGTHA